MSGQPRAFAAHALAVELAGRRVLEDVDLTLDPGELVGLIGPNGAGKTTLLRALAGLVPAARGDVLLDGRALASVSRRARARRLAYLPQDGGSHWALPVAELVMLGRLPHLGPWRRPGERDRQAVAWAMATADVTDLAERPVTQLSGGERARVLLARALAGEPEILLADEPVAGLDPYHRLEVMERLAGLAADGGAVLVVLHDLTLAARFCHRLVLLHGGRLAAEGAPEDVLSAERLAQVYRVRALAGREDGQPYILPWQRLPGGDGGAS